MKKKSLFIFIFIVLCWAINVSASDYVTEMDKFVDSIKVDGKIPLKAVKNTFLESSISAALKQYENDKYAIFGYYDEYEDKYYLVVFSKENGEHHKDYEVEYAFYEEDSNILKIVKENIKRFPTEEEKLFVIKDLENIKYEYDKYKYQGYYNYFNNILNYSYEAKSLITDPKIGIIFDTRRGDCDLLSTYEAGFLNMTYDGVVYDTTDTIGAKKINVIYVPDDTKDASDEYINAAKLRIKNEIPDIELSIKRVATLDNESKNTVKDYVDFSKTLNEYYEFKMFDQTYYFVIEKGTSKIPNPIYSITFNGNESDTGEMKKINLKYYDSIKLPKNEFVKKGYSFKSWNTKKDGSGTSYNNNQEISGLTKTYGKNITLYAQWTKNKYEIKFYGNHATSGSMENMSLKYNSSYNLTENGYLKKGYKFTGWNTKSDGSGTSYDDEQKIKNLSEKNNDTVKLYAQWTPIKYVIKFHGNENTKGSMSSQKVKYGKTVLLNDNEYSKSGYKFIEWNTKKDGSGTSYKNKAEIKNLSSKDGKIINLYAQWGKKYLLVFDANKGKISTKSKNIYLNDTYGNLPTPTKTGYIFKEWNTKKDGNGKKISKTTIVKEKKNQTIYAQWTPIQYTIKFDANGGIGKMQNMTKLKYNKSYELTNNAFTKKGYTFVGWNTKKDGSGTSYKNKASVKNLKSSNGATKVLYAQWKKTK